MTSQLNPPTASFSPLPHPDGSASYAWAGYKILASTNGPLEVQRRDEIPTEATLEVNVRDASGGGSPHTRHLENLLHRTLTSLILTHQYPRSLIQLTLQTLRTPRTPPNAANSGAGSLELLPHLLNASVLALMDANIALRDTAIGVAVMAGGDGERDGKADEAPRLALDEDGRDLEEARRRGGSVQVFVFGGAGAMYLAEGEGECSFEEWDGAAEYAEGICRWLTGKWLRGLVGQRFQEIGRQRGDEEDT